MTWPKNANTRQKRSRGSHFTLMEEEEEEEEEEAGAFWNNK